MHVSYWCGSKVKESLIWIWCKSVQNQWETLIDLWIVTPLAWSNPPLHLSWLSIHWNQTWVDSLFTKISSIYETRDVICQWWRGKLPQKLLMDKDGDFSPKNNPNSVKQDSNSPSGLQYSGASSFDFSPQSVIKCVFFFWAIICAVTFLVQRNRQWIIADKLGWMLKANRSTKNHV